MITTAKSPPMPTVYTLEKRLHLSIRTMLSRTSTVLARMMRDTAARPPLTSMERSPRRALLRRLPRTRKVSPPLRAPRKAHQMMGPPHRKALRRVSRSAPRKVPPHMAARRFTASRSIRLIHQTPATSVMRLLRAPTMRIRGFTTFSRRRSTTPT